MSLAHLTARKQLTVLGLNAGTSADGLDLAVLKIRRAGQRLHANFLAGRTVKYPDELRQWVLCLADTDTMNLAEQIRLDSALGIFFGRTARTFIKHLHKNGIKVDAVASHGQTVRHLPQITKLAGYQVRGSLQLGSLEQIAAITGRTTLGNFRQADIAAGGEGAPITGGAMARLFAHPKESRLIVNIGGMSNYFYFPSAYANQAKRAFAADCGPGNVLSDLLCQQLYQQPFDHSGRLAKAGRVSQRLLALLRAEPFFDNALSSTGRESFGLATVERMLACRREWKLAPEDLVATAAELTINSIVNALDPLIRRDRSISKLYLTGGGWRNKFFVRRLSEWLVDLEVTSIKQLGYDPDLVEAAAFAVMGEACLRSESLATGKRQPVLGQIVQPPRKG